MNNRHCVAYKRLIRTANLVVAGFLLGIAQVSGVFAAKSGKEIVENRCTMCHDLPSPSALSDKQWVVTLETMAVNAGLNKKEKAAVLEYLTSHGKKAVIIASMAHEKRLFDKKCSLCHTTSRVLLMPLTPDSRNHVVKRMQARAPDWISEEDVHEILEYLKQGAPGSDTPQHKPVAGGAVATFRERCTACHTAERVYLELKKGKNQGTAVVWGHIVNRMREKAPEWITDREAKLILEYLNSIKPVE